MNEIKTHRVGDKLNEEIKLERDPDTGHYHVQVRAHGAWGNKLKIALQSGDFGVAGPNGVSEEVLLAVVLDRLQRRMVQNSLECGLAVTKVRETLFWLGESRKA